MYSMEAAIVPIRTVFTTDVGTSKQVAETDPEIASLLGGYTSVAEPPGWEERERERQSTLTSEKDSQTDRDSTAKGIIAEFSK